VAALLGGAKRCAEAESKRPRGRLASIAFGRDSGAGRRAADYVGCGLTKGRRPCAAGPEKLQQEAGLTLAQQLEPAAAGPKRN